MPMFIVRNDGTEPAGLTIKLQRRTPAIVPAGAGRVDWFCLGDPEAARRAGHDVVALHDGWYANDAGGGIAIFGPYWELRDTPFSVREVAATALPETRADDATEIVNVRKAIFGA